MAWNNELGKWGEEVAARYLTNKGYYIRDKDWKHGHRDLDIIAIYNDELVIVEVKTRKHDKFGDPEDAVDAKKIRSIRIAANAYIKMFKIDYHVRFDVIAITGTEDNGYNINHIENAFKAMFY